MVARKTQSVAVTPSLAPERAFSALGKQLESLRSLRGQKFAEAEHAEQEWSQHTEAIVERTFGNPSTELNNFYRARTAGDYVISPFGNEWSNAAQDQGNFLIRINAFEAFLKSALSTLELTMPEAEVQGQYDPGQEYEFYRDIKAILSSAKTQVTIVDPYLDTGIFDVYADGIDRAVGLRILTKNLPSAVRAVANKYAAGRKLDLLTTSEIHDRLIFIDDRVWFIGQSIKDAARKKPTYIVEQDASLVRPVYETIWNAATVLI